MATRLTTTSYCLLGLLNLRSFSAYELTKYMKRSALAELWPRTEAAIYREGSRLSDHGLVAASTEQNGKRTRTIYCITPEGRAAFEAWLGERGTPLTFECEVAAKAFFGDAGDIDTLRAHLVSVRNAFAAKAADMAPVIEDWLEGDLAFPDRLQYTALTADLISRVHEAADSWAADWLERIEDWDETSLDAASEAQAHDVIADLGDVARTSEAFS